MGAIVVGFTVEVVVVVKVVDAPIFSSDYEAIRTRHHHMTCLAWFKSGGSACMEHGHDVSNRHGSC